MQICTPDYFAAPSEQVRLTARERTHLMTVQEEEEEETKKQKPIEVGKESDSALELTPSPHCCSHRVIVNSPMRARSMPHSE